MKLLLNNDILFLNSLKNE